MWLHLESQWVGSEVVEVADPRPEGVAVVGGGGGKKRLWREEMFRAGAARPVLEVFERRRGQTARSVTAPLPLAASCPLSARFGGI